jgi:hypothetical protein
MRTDDVPRRLPWYTPSIADVLFVLLLLGILQNAGSRMMDDPGLGWHLRIADLMWERGGFLEQEEFCFPTEGQPWVTQAWLCDILFRLAYAWGGLNGIAVLSTVVVALALRCLYTWMVADGVNWLAAAFWTFLAALGTAPSWVARPNVVTLLGVVLVTQVCERYHSGTIAASKTWWLVPLFLLWPNMHGGFLAGALILGVTWLVECGMAVAVGTGGLTNRGKTTLTDKLLVPPAARRRLRHWTLLGTTVFAATLVNPSGWGLYLWNLRMVTDPFIQTSTTQEWLPPDFTAQGWFRIEMLILLFPLLAAFSERRMSLLSVVLSVVWLHFALTTRRYTPLWVLVATPTLAQLSCGIPWRPPFGRCPRLAARLRNMLSEDLQQWLTRTPRNSPFLISIVFAGLLLLASPWLGNMARHNPELIPAHALDEFLTIDHGQRAVHSLNWGGYLIWHGWDRTPRFKAWIDDRLDVHGRLHTEEHVALMEARPGWENVLDEHNIQLACIPTESQLAARLADSPDWRELFRESQVIIFRRAQAADEAKRDEE